MLLSFYLCLHVCVCASLSLFHIHVLVLGGHCTKLPFTDEGQAARMRSHMKFGKVKHMCVISILGYEDDEPWQSDCAKTGQACEAWHLPTAQMGTVLTYFDASLVGFT